MTTCNFRHPLQKIRNIFVWLLNTDKIPNPKGSFQKMLKKIPGNGCMDDLQFYVLFNSISVTDYVRVIMMELFLRLERSPPLQEGIKPGMDNLPFHVLSNSISIIPPSKGGIKPGMDNLPFHVLLNSISIISGRCGDDDERLCEVEHRL